jgi:hypothetical protein
MGWAGKSDQITLRLGRSNMFGGLKRLIDKWFLTTPGRLSRSPRRVCLSIERLDDRITPSTLTVPSSVDGLAAGTLRSTIAQANTDSARGVAETIVFSSALNGKTISLTQGILNLTPGSGLITVNGSNQVSISGMNAHSVFVVDYGAHALLEGLTIENGNASDGGGVYNVGVCQ